jgi:alkylhydroperoxidase family enzyme
VDTNASGASKAGASEERIAAVLDFRSSSLFSEAERVAFELAEAMTVTPPAVTDKLFARLREVYSEEQMVEMAAVIKLENFRNRFNRCFGVEPNGFYGKLGELLESAGL